MNLIELINCEMIIQQTNNKIEELSEKTSKKIEKANETSSIYEFFEMWLSNNQLNVIDYFTTEEMSQHIYQESAVLLKNEGISFKGEDIRKFIDEHEIYYASDVIDSVGSWLSKDSLVFFDDVSVSFKSKFGEYSSLTSQEDLQEDLLYNTQKVLEEFMLINDYLYDKEEEELYKKRVQELVPSLKLEFPFKATLEKTIPLSSSHIFRSFFSVTSNFLEVWFKEIETFFDDLLSFAEFVSEGREVYLNTMVDLIIEEMNHTSD